MAELRRTTCPPRTYVAPARGEPGKYLAVVVLDNGEPAALVPEGSKNALCDSEEEAQAAINEWTATQPRRIAEWHATQHALAIKRRCDAVSVEAIELLRRVISEISRYDDFSDDAADAIVAAARTIIAKTEATNDA